MAGIPTCCPLLQLLQRFGRRLCGHRLSGAKQGGQAGRCATLARLGGRVKEFGLQNGQALAAGSELSWRFLDHVSGMRGSLSRLQPQPQPAHACLAASQTRQAAPQHADIGTHLLCGAPAAPWRLCTFLLLLRALQQVQSRTACVHRQRTAACHGACNAGACHMPQQAEANLGPGLLSRMQLPPNVKLSLPTDTPVHGHLTVGWRNPTLYSPLTAAHLGSRLLGGSCCALRPRHGSSDGEVLLL